MWEVIRLDSTEYKPLDWLEGCEVEALSLPVEDHLPEKITVLKDYPKGILLELLYVATVGWTFKEPRKYRYFCSKSSLACGDVVLTHNGVRITREDLL